MMERVVVRGAFALLLRVKAGSQRVAMKRLGGCVDICRPHPLLFSLGVPLSSSQPLHLSHSSPSPSLSPPPPG